MQKQTVDQQKTTLRLFNVDFARVLAMLMVIAIHTILNFTIRPDFFGTKLWFVIEPIVAISKSGVLLFFMLSGYLVLNKNKTISQTLQRTKTRLVIPLVFFYCLSVAYDFFQDVVGYGYNFSEFWHSQLLHLTDFPNSFLWFLEVLIALYLLNPVWQLFFNKEAKPELARYVTMLALCFSVVAHIFQIPGLQSGTSFTALTSWLDFTFFYFYGGLASNGWVRINRRYVNYLFILIGVIATIIADYFTSYSALRSSQYIWISYISHLNIPEILVSVGIFNEIIPANFQWLDNRKLTLTVKRIIMWLAGLSFGIYLIHPFVISVLIDMLGFDFNWLKINVYLYNVINYCLVFGISTTVIFIISKIPLMKKIIGG